MKMKVVLLFFVVAITPFYSQNSRIDSLMVVLRTNKKVSEKAQTLNAIADEYKTSDSKKMMQYAQSALLISQKNNLKIEEGNAYSNFGNANIIIGNYADAIRNFDKAAKIFEKLCATSKYNPLINKGLAKAYGGIGVAYSEQSNYSAALQFYLKSVRLYDNEKDEAKCSSLYNNIGIIYQSKSSYALAQNYFFKAKKIKEKLNDPSLGITITNIANGYLKQKNFDKAFEYYSKAKMSLDKNPNPRALGEWYNNFGLLYKATNDFPKAIENWNLAIQTFNSIEDKFGKQDSHLYLGQLYFEQNQLDKAFTNASTSLALSKQTGTLEQTMLSEKLISDIYSKQNNIQQAFTHYKLYNKAKDSLINEESTRKGVEAEMNFNFEKKEAIHKKEIEKKEILLREESKRNKLQFVFAILFGLLLFGIGFLIYNRIQLKKTLTLQKELAEYEQKALHLQMNPHFVFNCLGSISSFIVNNGTESAIKYLSKFSKLMRLTLEYSKESLIPIDKEIESLENYLELEQLRFNYKFNFEIIKDKEIEDDMAIPTILLQPFVENAIMHGVIPKKEMGKIIIHFSIENNALICTIEDNGIGYYQSKLMKEKTVVIHKSMALDITKKRLQMIASSTNQNAFFTIEEINNDNVIKGTKVQMHLPIQYIN